MGIPNQSQFVKKLILLMLMASAFTFATASKTDPDKKEKVKTEVSNDTNISMTIEITQSGITFTNHEINIGDEVQFFNQSGVIEFTKIVDEDLKLAFDANDSSALNKVCEAGVVTVEGIKYCCNYRPTGSVSCSVY